jgi:hypothetical protein
MNVLDTFTTRMRYVVEDWDDTDPHMRWIHLGIALQRTRNSFKALIPKQSNYSDNKKNWRKSGIIDSRPRWGKDIQKYSDYLTSIDFHMENYMCSLDTLIKEYYDCKSHPQGLVVPNSTILCNEVFIGNFEWMVGVRKICPSKSFNDVAVLGLMFDKLAKMPELKQFCGDPRDKNSFISKCKRAHKLCYNLVLRTQRLSFKYRNGAGCERIIDTTSSGVGL